MTQVNTDFLLKPGNTYSAVRVTVTAVTKYPMNHGPEQSLTTGGGMSVGRQNNNGGRYGWVTFGKQTIKGYFLYPKQDLNYFNQVFEPPVEGCTVLRVWLAPGVNADLEVDSLNWVTKVLIQLVKALVQKIASQQLSEKTPATGPQLPAPVPGPPALPGPTQ